MMWGVFLLGLANGWRAIGLGQQSELLLTLSASLNPWIGIGLAVFWSIVFIGTAVALWQHRGWTRWMIPLLILMHGIYYLVLVMGFARSAVSRNGWPAIGLLFGLAVLFSIWALYRPSVGWYFKE